MSCSTCPCPKYNSPTHNSIQCCDVSEVDSGCKNKCVQNLENSDKVVVVVDGNSIMKRSSQLLNSSYLKNLNENSINSSESENCKFRQNTLANLFFFFQLNKTIIIMI